MQYHPADNDDWGVDPSIQLVPIDGPASRPRPRRRILFYLLIGGAVFLSLSAVLAALATIARIGQMRGMDVAVTWHRDRESLRAESVRVFEEFEASELQSNWSPAEVREREEIEALFRRLESLAAEQDQAGFHELVDFNRLLRRVELTGNLRGWNFLDKRMVRGEIKSSAEPDPNWQKVTVAGVVAPNDEPATRLVYAYCLNSETQDATEERFWIARDGDSWRIYDWERLDLGLPESKEWGLYIKYAQSPQMDGFRRWAELVGESDASVTAGDYDAAKAKLRSAEAQPTPPDLHDFRWVLTGYRWMALGESSEAERCHKNVRQPDDTPGAYFGLMNCLRWKDAAQALRNAERYESAVGPTAELLQLKGSLLERLGRKDEAVAQWKSLLRIRPADTSALTELFRSLPEDEKTSFEHELERLDDPVAAASGMAASVGYRDYQGLSFLVDYLRRKSPQAAGTRYVAGLAMFLDGRYPEAADLYRQAFEAETEENKRSQYVNSYVEAMAADGRVVEAMNAVPDQEAAFEYVFYSYDDDSLALTDEEYAGLVELYREKFPDDLDGLYREALVAVRQERYDDAVRLLRTALERAEKGDEDSEYYRDSLARSLALVLMELGQLQEAYEVGDSKDRFAQLARSVIDDRRWDDVRRLLEEHRAAHGDDPRIHYVEGELAAHAEDWDAAVRHFREGLERAAEEDKWQLRRRLADATIESGRWREQFNSANDAAETFDSLAARFVADENWPALDSLIAEHRRRSPADLRIAKYEAETAWQRKDYSTYAARAPELLASDDENILAYYERQTAENRLLSALLQSGQLGRARHFAEEKQREDQSSAKIAIVEAAAGYTTEAKRLARESAAAADSAHEFYRDPVAGRVFLSTEFADLQQEFPVRFPYDVAPTLAVFIFDEPPQLEAAHIAAALRELGIPESAARLLASVRQDVNKAFVLETANAGVWLATGESSFNAKWEVSAEQSPHADLLKRGRGWLAIGTASWSDTDRKDAEEVARGLAGQLVDGRAAAMCIRGREVWEGFTIYRMEPVLLTAWQLSGSLKPDKDDGSAISEKAHDEVAANRQFSRSLRDAVRTFESAPGTALEVIACLTDGAQLDPLTLDVGAVRRAYGSLEFDGRLKTGSQLIAELAAGLPMRISEHQIRGWRLDGGESVYRP